MVQEAQQVRSLVAVFDIELFSERAIGRREELVRTFVDLLGRHLDGLKDLGPDVYSTGDGVLVSIGRCCNVDRGNTERFVRFAIDLAATLSSRDVTVRTAINYSDDERIVAGDTTVLEGQRIQVGDTIDTAARMLAFCEAREVMISDALERRLRSLGLGGTFTFRANPELAPRHGLRLKTHTFEPWPELHGVLYSPNSPLQTYKRYAGFPPISTELVEYYKTSGLEGELKKVVSAAYGALKNINDTKTFISANDVLTVLMRRYDASDEFYIISRSDRDTGFWSQDKKSQYIAYLDANAREHGGFINQQRAWVYDARNADELEPGDSIFRDLDRLQRPGTLKSFPVSQINHYEVISELIFGFTLSTKFGYAIIPVPSFGFNLGDLKAEQIGEMLRPHISYKTTDGPLRAVITADEEYIGRLTQEFEALMAEAGGTRSRPAPGHRPHTASKAT